MATSALTTSELLRIKVELGYNAESFGAEPYIGVAALFETVVAKYLLGGPETTAVTEVEAGALAAPVSIVLDDPTGIAVHDRVAIDVDDSEELATVRSVSGNAIWLLLSKAHSGSYPVAVESGVTMARRLLRRCESVGRKIESGRGTGALAQVDDVKFFDTKGSKSQLELWADELELHRDELARVLGVERINRGATRAAGNPGGWRQVLY